MTFTQYNYCGLMKIIDNTHDLWLTRLIKSCTPLNYREMASQGDDFEHIRSSYDNNLINFCTQLNLLVTI